MFSKGKSLNVSLFVGEIIALADYIAFGGIRPTVHGGGFESETAVMIAAALTLSAKGRGVIPAEYIMWRTAVPWWDSSTGFWFFSDGRSIPGVERRLVVKNALLRIGEIAESWVDRDNKRRMAK